jgi:hypothetical protein
VSPHNEHVIWIKVGDEKEINTEVMNTSLTVKSLKQKFEEITGLFFLFLIFFF